jgi:hypothetical protein
MFFLFNQNCIGMKKLLLFSVLAFAAITLKAQLFESFSDGILPANWSLAQGIQVSDYSDPANNCNSDFGLRTPGVGGSNPSKILTPALIYHANKPYVNTGFKIYVFNANLNCVPTKPFPCATYVEVYLVKSTVTSATIPAQSEIYTSAPIQVVKANDVNFSYFQAPPIPDGSQYRVLFDFKSTLNCNQPNTKYILDEFSVLETAGGPLPVRFTSFEAKKVNGKISLKWQTATELNCKEYEVQRKLSNGRYLTIATIPSKSINGASTANLDYTFDDISNLSGAGQLYYRIKQIDIDGLSNYSEIRSVRNNAKQFGITIYPNPGLQPKITIPGDLDKVDISIFDLSGREVMKWTATTLKLITISGLSRGMYNIRVSVKETGDVLSEKLLIQ